MVSPRRQDNPNRFLLQSKMSKHDAWRFSTDRSHQCRLIIILDSVPIADRKQRDYLNIWMTVNEEADTRSKVDSPA